MREIRSIRLFSLIVSSLILMLLMVRTQYLYSQNDKKAQTENDSLDISRIAADVDRFMEAQLRSQGHSKIYSDTALITKLFSVSPNTPNTAEAYSDWYEGQMYALRGDLGFRLSSSYQENFEPGILTDEDITYLRRLYLGLDWDLLGGGLLSNRAKIRSLKAQQELAREEYHTQSKEGHYLFLHSYFTYIFKKEKQGLLSRRKEVIDEQLRIARRMYLIRLTSWEKLLELESKAQEVNILLNDNQVYYSSRMKEGLAGLFDDETLMYDFLPVFEIDAEKMIEIFNRSADRERMLELQTERYRLENWKFSDYTFRPYLRYNLMQTDATTTRNYATAGFTASIPLRFRSPYRDALNARLRIAGNEQQTESLAAGNELLNHFYEYQYRKMQYTSFYFKKLKLEERLRKEMVMRDFDDESFSPLRVLQILEEMLAVETETIDLKKDMYLKLLKIFTYLDTDNPNDFIRIVNPGDMGRRYSGHRYLYIWSEEFGSVSNEHILAFLKNNEIREVLVSPGLQNEEKFRDFVFLAGTRDIQTHLMIGENRMLDGEGNSRLASQLEKYSDYLIRGVHIDIEPHTRDDFRNATSGYLTRYSTLLQTAREFCNARGLKLSASIPVFYDESYLNSVYGICDRVFVMAYGKPVLESIAGKMEEELLTGKSKTVLALRPEDFSNRMEMERFAADLMKRLDISELALHDLRRLIDIDARSVLQTP